MARHSHGGDRRLLALGARTGARILAAAASLALLVPIAAQAVPCPPGPAGSGTLGNYRPNARIVTTDCITGPAGHRILVLGDSITVRTKDVLVATLTAAGWAVCIDARAGQPTSAALDYYAAQGQFPDYVDAIVMATGSNDIFEPAKLPANVKRARSYAGSRPLLWVNAYVHRSHVSPTFAAHDLVNSRRVNQYVLNRYGWRFVTATIDWYGYLSAKPYRQSAYLTDGVHPSVAGAYARSVVIAQGLAGAVRPRQGAVLAGR